MSPEHQNQELIFDMHFQSSVCELGIVCLPLCMLHKQKSSSKTSQKQLGNTTIDSNNEKELTQLELP